LKLVYFNKRLLFFVALTCTILYILDKLIQKNIITYTLLFFLLFMNNKDVYAMLHRSVLFYFFSFIREINKCVHILVQSGFSTSFSISIVIEYVINLLNSLLLYMMDWWRFYLPPFFMKINILSSRENKIVWMYLYCILQQIHDFVFLPNSLMSNDYKSTLWDE
jgi:hypothetical protein